MSTSVIVHIVNEDPILCELERVPDANDQIVVVNNPRRKDGTDIHYLEDEVVTMIIPWHRITFIQVLPSAEVDDIIGFVRE